MAPFNPAVYYNNNPLLDLDIEMAVNINAPQTDRLCLRIDKIIDERFKEMMEHLNKRFDTIDKRFDNIDQRFDNIDKRFHKRFDNIDNRSSLSSKSLFLPSEP
jgi:hypothetical protein